MGKFSIFICMIDDAKSMTLTQWNFEGEDMYQRVDSKDILGHWVDQLPESGSSPFKFIETLLLKAYREGGAVFICNNNDHVILLKRAFVELQRDAIYLTGKRIERHPAFRIYFCPNEAVNTLRTLYWHQMHWGSPTLITDLEKGGNEYEG